jgi:hypothetical protein
MVLPPDPAAHYRADFVYLNKDGHLVVEDAKGFRRKECLLKRKLTLLVHGTRIKETVPMKRMPRKRVYPAKKEGLSTRERISTDKRLR